MPVSYATISRFPNHRFGDDGSVWTLHNNRWGNAIEWKKLKGSIGVSGYRIYNIPDESGRSIPRYGHRLILEAFYGPSNGLQGCHGDGNPDNNALTNLRWGTAIENAADTGLHGRRCEGERVKTSKLTQSQVRSIFSRRRNGESLKSLAAEFNVNESCVSKIANGLRWKAVTSAS